MTRLVDRDLETPFAAVNEVRAPYGNSESCQRNRGIGARRRGDPETRWQMGECGRGRSSPSSRMTVGAPHHSPARPAERKEAQDSRAHRISHVIDPRQRQWPVLSRSRDLPFRADVLQLSVRALTTVRVGQRLVSNSAFNCWLYLQRDHRDRKRRQARTARCGIAGVIQRPYSRPTTARTRSTSVRDGPQRGAAGVCSAPRRPGDRAWSGTPARGASTPTGSMMPSQCNGPLQIDRGQSRHCEPGAIVAAARQLRSRVHHGVPVDWLNPQQDPATLAVWPPSRCPSTQLSPPVRIDGRSTPVGQQCRKSAGSWPDRRGRQVEPPHR